MAALIRKFRKAAGLSQQQLAERVGTTLHAVYMWERGTRTPHLTHVVCLADVLDVTIDELVGRVRPTPKKRGRP
jgi:transcriptional regulator with XRE-family HTH domain